MALSSREKDNLTRWDGHRMGWHEVYYLKWNDPKTQTAAWIRYTLLCANPPRTGKAGCFGSKSGENPGSPPNPHREPEVTIWAVFFDGKDSRNNAAAKKTYSIRDARIEKEIFYLSAGPSAIFDVGARGELEDGPHRFSWEIRFDDEKAISLRQFPWPLYFEGFPFPKTKLTAPYWSTRISGEFTVNDRSFILDQVPGHQAHVWGTEQATSWVWGHCNTFDDPTFCFEGLSARVRVGEKILPPMTLLFFSWEGEMYSFNSPRQWITNRSLHELDRWRFEAGGHNLRFVGNGFVDTKDMVGLRYEDPTGSERFCHNTKVADLKIEILKKGKSGWASVKTVTASRSAAFEVVNPTPSGLLDQVKIFL